MTLKMKKINSFLLLSDVLSEELLEFPEYYLHFIMKNLLFIVFLAKNTKSEQGIQLGSRIELEISWPWVFTGRTVQYTVYVKSM